MIMCVLRAFLAFTASQSRESTHCARTHTNKTHRLKEMVLKWLPVNTNQAIDGEAPELGDSPIKAGVCCVSVCVFQCVSVSAFFTCVREHQLMTYLLFPAEKGTMYPCIHAQHMTVLAVCCVCFRVCFYMLAINRVFREPTGSLPVYC